MMGRAFPIERGVLHNLASLVRREGKAIGFGWRGTGPTS